METVPVLDNPAAVVMVTVWLVAVCEAVGVPEIIQVVGAIERPAGRNAVQLLTVDPPAFMVGVMVRAE